MAMCQTRLRQNGGEAKLANPNQRNLRLLLLTGIDRIFEIFNDETDAVNSFFPDREIFRFDILEFIRQTQRGSGPTNGKL